MKYLYKNKHWELNKEYNIDKLLYLIIDRPNKVGNNFYIWLNNKKQKHRDYDLPSRIFIHLDNETCSLTWDVNHKHHRINNKPAYIRYDGYKGYYINDKFIKSEQPK